MLADKEAALPARSAHRSKLLDRRTNRARMMQDEFSVYQFFEDESYERVRECVTAQEAVEAFKHYTQNPAATLGIVRRVIIVDGGDFTNMEWRFGEGITFPKKANGTTL
jgi:hypothetical protein